MPTDALAKLDLRIRRHGFGKINLGVKELPALHGVITVTATGTQREDLTVFLAYLIKEHSLDYKQDMLELSYEHGRLTLARITFAG